MRGGGDGGGAAGRGDGRGGRLPILIVTVCREARWSVVGST